MTTAWTEILGDLLEGLKIDLGISTTVYDSRLTTYLQSAYEAISEQGATLNSDSIRDRQLVIMYAAWTWRRRDSGEGMPRMIRYALNNRIFSEKMKGDS